MGAPEFPIFRKFIEQKLHSHRDTSQEHLVALLPPGKQDPYGEY